jgi:Protein tyrosine and serine/threonine kinase
MATRTWGTDTNSLSQVRAYPTAATVGALSYVAGGSISFVGEPRVDVYNYTSKSWSRATDLGTGRFGMMGVTVGGYAFFFSHGDATGGLSSDVFRYGPDGSYSFFTAPEAMKFACGVGIGDNLIIAGGDGFSDATIAFAFDTASSTWSNISGALSSGIAGKAACGAHGVSAVWTGGFLPGKVNRTKNTYLFDASVVTTGTGGAPTTGSSTGVPTTTNAPVVPTTAGGADAASAANANGDSGVVIGIVVGVAGGIVLCLLIVIFIMWRRNRQDTVEWSSSDRVGSAAGDANGPSATGSGATELSGSSSDSSSESSSDSSPVIARTAADLTHYRSLLKDVEITGELGKGQFGQVFRAKQDGTEYAVKQLLASEDDDAEKEFMEELEIMLTLESPRVVAVHGVCLLGIEQGGGLGLVLELCPNGSLDHFLAKNKEDLTAVDLTSISLHVAEGLAFLHKRDVLHRDLVRSVPL